MTPARFSLALLSVLLLISCKKQPAPQQTGDLNSASSIGTSGASSSSFMAEVIPLEDAASTTSGEPLTFSADHVPATLLKSSIAASIDTELLGACAGAKPQDYYQTLPTQFGSATQTVYSFLYAGMSDDEGLYLITMLPNKPGYKTMKDFLSDFDLCGQPGDLQPKALNADWLVFTTNCAPIAEGQVSGCQQMKTAIDPTITLRP